MGEAPKRRGKFLPAGPETSGEWMEETACNLAAAQTTHGGKKTKNKKHRQETNEGVRGEPGITELARSADW